MKYQAAGSNGNTGTIVFENDYEAQLLWSALHEYRKLAKADMANEYANRDPMPSAPYTVEDDMFLGDLISKLSKMQYDLEQGGFTERFGVL